MESVVVKSKGRKRKRKDGEDENNNTRRKIVLGMRCVVLVGRYVKKEFEGSGEFLGKIVSYDSGLYRVVYEDGDFEDLETGEAKGLLVGENEMDGSFRKRKKLLDQFILKKHGKKETVKSKAGAKKVETVGNNNGVKLVVDDKVDNAVKSVVADKVDNGDKVENSAVSEAKDEVDVDSESSSSDLSDYEPSADVAEVERPWVPPPQLPLSSGNFGVMEEDVSNLLSVYSFLRSFSVCLFLSPFGLDEFVGALNCSVHNTLLDAIHVALIRALKSHVEVLSSEGSELASKCLRIIDWSLLDSLTWPVFIVQYLTTMRYTEEQEWKAFYANVWEKDYYTLSAGRKLAILQLLCDDASNSAEIRTEIDNREESEIGPDPDGVTVSRSDRSSKNYLPKDQEAVKKASDDDDDDGNGDECRLCGMDGTLICCDGCPSSYHSRCIGMMKLSIPEGEWYCPECTVNRIGPIVTKKTSLRGAEFFGIDPYEQVFLGSCDHLLVMKTSTSSSSHIQYYSSVDIQNVLHALTCSAEYTSLYMEICKGILQYWEIPENVFSFSHSVGIDNKNGGIINTQDVVITAENVNNVAEKCEELGFGQDSLNESNIKSMCDLPKLPSENKEVELGFGQDESNINSMCDLPKLPSENKEVELGFGQDSLNESNINSVYDLPKLPYENKEVELGFGQDSLNESNINSVCDLPKLPSVNKEVEFGFGFGQDSLNESNINSVCDLPKLPSENKEVKSYMGLSFKPHAYLNVYIHGDFAASAGASLAILSSEEKLGTQTQSSTISHRKLMSANYSLQAKAFSLAAKRFYWPNYEKKLVEVSRERCGWCLSCKAAVNSKRGCLLNAAASNAIKGVAKVLSSLRQSKNVESSLASIATYVMFMEESLYGLTVGPFLNSSYRNQWQKHVEEAASLGEIKAYLLEFERNIHDIAFSTDWVRLVDDTGSESQLGQTAKNVMGSTQKRGLGRRGRKAAVIIPEIPDTEVKDLSTDFAWWRGGMLSKHVFQKGILPLMMIKHAARQGGCGKINGVHYVDGLEVPKRSRQFIWRAAVDMSKTASQLALQVRYLDLHVRWNELVCPEQTPQEGKGLEAEAYAFRNACIIDKKTLGNKISYGVIFENQKHLPSRVLKKILEVEETGDKRSKNWFLGTHIPLYLIKEYEVATVADVKNNWLISDVKHMSRSSKFNKKQLNCSGKNIFSFLEQKRDNMGKCFCTFCQHDVSFRVAARCNACQGYCHEQCAVGTNIHTTARVEFIITCKRCYIEKEGARKNEIVGDSPTSPLLLQGKESQRSATVIKIKFGKQNGHERPLECSNVRSSQPQKSKSGKKNSKNRLLQPVDQKPKNIKSKTGSENKTSKNKCLGLIWKKKNVDDTGVEFRINNILFKGNPNGHLLAPKCHLCAQPYNSDLMYILCEKCNNWFHADSVNLQESKIMELYGFKCCRCRRIRNPICPYTDPDTRSKLELKKVVVKSQRIKNSELELEINSDSCSDFDFVSETNDELINDWEPDSTSDFDANVQEEHEQEHPFYSFPTVDQVNVDKLEADSGPGPKKLPVRRHTKPERESNPGVDISSYSGINNPNPDPIESSTPIVEWDVSTNGFADDMMFDYGDLNYEDMEFEPQTYFSFNELLASDEGDKGGPNPDPVPQVTGPAPGDCNPDQYQMGITYDEQEPMFSVESGLDMVPCRVCSQADPCPDLFCQTCGLWLHQHCSPWEEDSSWEPETGWKCGNCREWS